MATYGFTVRTVQTLLSCIFHLHNNVAFSFLLAVLSQPGLSCLLLKSHPILLVKALVLSKIPRRRTRDRGTVRQGMQSSLLVILVTLRFDQNHSQILCRKTKSYMSNQNDEYEEEISAKGIYPRVFSTIV